MTAVIFDVGGVLIQWDPRHLYRRLFNGDDAAMERFLTHVCSVTWNLMQDAGRPFADGVAQLSERFPEHAALIEAFDTHWQEMVPDVIGETVEIAHTLYDRGVPLYALTNFSAEKFPLVRRRYDVFDLFDGIVVSGEIGVIKPDRAIYLHLLERFGLAAADCLFIDDSPFNVLGAEAVGMAAIRYVSPRQLCDELTARSLL